MYDVIKSTPASELHKQKLTEQDITLQTIQKDTVENQTVTASNIKDDDVTVVEKWIIYR